MDSLPKDLLPTIHANLPVSDFMRSLSVCKLWCSHSCNDWIWNSFLIRDFDVKPMEKGAKERYAMLFQMGNTMLTPWFNARIPQNNIMETADGVLGGQVKDRAIFVGGRQGTSTALSFSVFSHAFRTPESITYVICSGRRAGAAFLSLVVRHDQHINSRIKYEGDCIELKNGSSVIILAGYEWLEDRKILEYVKNPKARVFVDGVRVDYLASRMTEINASSDVIKEIGLTFLTITTRISGDPFFTIGFSKWLKAIPRPVIM